MSGYLKATVQLMQEIETINKEKGTVDFLLIKEKFFSIEKSLYEIKNFENHFRDAIDARHKHIKNSVRGKDQRVLVSYLNMVERLGASSDPMISCGIVSVMIPVICIMIREQQS